MAGQQLWATVDSPWVSDVDRDRYAATVRDLAATGLEVVLSTHLPPAHGRGDALLDVLAGAPDLPAFVGPDQAALEALLAGFAPDGARRSSGRPPTPARRRLFPLAEAAASAGSVPELVRVGAGGLAPVERRTARPCPAGVSSKSKTSRFCRSRSGLADFGIGDQAVLDVPAQHDLGRRPPGLLGDAGDHRLASSRRRCRRAGSTTR